MSTNNVFPVTNTMIGMTNGQVFAAFAKLLANDAVAVLHMHYPEVDERNHKSLDTLVAALSGHGFTETAALVSEQVPVLITHNLEKANRVLHEIQRDSVAISATLHYKGFSGAPAEAQLLQDLSGANYQ